MGLDSTGLVCIDLLLCLGWVGCGWYIRPKPVQLKPINLIQSKQTNAMQPHPMNPMMPSKHSQGNRTNPSSQHNQSYQYNQPVQTSKAMTSIISNKSSQPIKSIKSNMQTINPFNKTNYMELDWMWLITLGRMGLHWMGIACTAYWLHGFGLGWIIGIELMRFGYIRLCCLCFECLWFDSLRCLFLYLLRFHLTRLGFQLITLVDWFVWLFISMILID